MDLLARIFVGVSTAWIPVEDGVRKVSLVCAEILAKTYAVSSTSTTGHSPPPRQPGRTAADDGADHMAAGDDPETRQLLYDDFDAIWMYAINSRAPLGARAAIRTRMTKRVLETVEAGERDPEKLRLAALKGLE